MMGYVRPKLYGQGFITSALISRIKAQRVGSSGSDSHGDSPRWESNRRGGQEKSHALLGYTRNSLLIFYDENFQAGTRKFRHRVGGGWSRFSLFHHTPLL